MKKRGLLTKSKCPGDARGVLVTLTDQGMTHLEDAVPDHVETVRRLIFDHLNEDRADKIREFFADVIGAQELPTRQC